MAEILRDIPGAEVGHGIEKVIFPVKTVSHIYNDGSIGFEVVNRFIRTTQENPIDTEGRSSAIITDIRELRGRKSDSFEQKTLRVLNALGESLRSERRKS